MSFGILGQVWYLIVLIPDHCTLTNFNVFLKMSIEPAFLTVRVRVFHSIGAEQENDPSYMFLRDFGT